MESKNNWKAWLYLAPALILLSVFTFFPIINTVIVSFTKDYDVIDASFSGFTFDNYIDILTPIHNANGNDGTAFESVMLIGLPNTLLLTFITVPISIILSLIIAICLNSIKFFKKIFQTIFFMPYVTNAIAIGTSGTAFHTRFSSSWVASRTSTPSIMMPRRSTAQDVSRPLSASPSRSSLRRFSTS